MDARPTTEILKGAIREWQAADYSMRQAMASYRSLGGRIRTAEFAILWRAEKAAAEERAA